MLKQFTAVMENSESQAEAKEKPAQDKHGDAVKGGVLKHIKQDYQCYENGENYAFGSFQAFTSLLYYTLTREKQNCHLLTQGREIPAFINLLARRSCLCPNRR